MSNSLDSVMLIDDNDIDNFVNKEILEATRFCETIYTEDDPNAAIKTLQTLASGGMKSIPKILFLDINMPLMNGFEFLMEYEKLPAAILDNCRIVILTSSLNQSDLSSAMDNPHVVDYIEKPLTEDSLSKIKAHIVKGKN